MAGIQADTTQYHTIESQARENQGLEDPGLQQIKCRKHKQIQSATCKATGVFQYILQSIQSNATDQDSGQHRPVSRLSSSERIENHSGHTRRNAKTDSTIDQKFVTALSP